MAMYSGVVANSYNSVFGGIPLSGGWKLAARTSLGSVSDTIEVTGLEEDRYYQYLYHLIPSGGTVSEQMQFGNASFDVTANYAYRTAANGGTENPQNTQGEMDVGFTASDDDKFGVGYISNFASHEKLLRSYGSCDRGDAGVANAPNHGAAVAKWADTTDPIERIRLENSGTGDYATDSELVVLEFDPLDRHSNTDNFWAEVDRVDLSGGAGDSLDFGAVTSRKYYWLTAFFEASGNIRPVIRFNNDATVQYADRRSLSGAAWVASANRSNIVPDITVVSTNVFWSIFIVNVSAREKLLIGRTVTQGTAGAANDVFRTEHVSKWVNTASQINDIEISNGETGDMGTKTKAVLWGAD